MSFRQLFIAKPCNISIDKNNVLIEMQEHENHIPIEDLTMIMIESRGVNLSSSVFSHCAKYDVPIFICGDNHVPSSLSIGINTHYRPYDMLQKQTQQSQKFKQEISECLLKTKVNNQKVVLELVGASEESIVLLDAYIDEIQGHDEINREGTAAKVFFNQLYGKNYVRFDKDCINAQQNYGYAIFAAAISRVLTMFGFNLCIGVNHCGKTNPFNLTYDIIEPFRPIVDYYIYKHRQYLTDELSIQSKKELVNLLNARVIVKNKQVTVQYAMELLVKSYLRLLEGEEVVLDVPTVQEILFERLNESV